MMFLSNLKVLMPIVALAVGMCFGVQAFALRGPGPATENEAVPSPLPGEQSQAGLDAKDLLKQSLELATKTEDDETRIRLLLRIGYVQVRLGERAEALSTADQALNLAKKLDADRGKSIIEGDLRVASKTKRGDKKASMATLQVGGEVKPLGLLEPQEKGTSAHGCGVQALHCLGIQRGLAGCG